MFDHISKCTMGILFLSSTLSFTLRLLQAISSPSLSLLYLSLHLSFSYYVPFPYGNLARYLLTICRVYAIIMPLLLFNRLSHKSILFLVLLLYAKKNLCRSIFCSQFKIIKSELSIFHRYYIPNVWHKNARQMSPVLSLQNNVTTLLLKHHS